MYAGGDDLLAFCPAVTALDFTAAIRHQVGILADGPLGTAGPDGGPVTASTAVVFTHMSSPAAGGSVGRSGGGRRAPMGAHGTRWLSSS